MFKLEQEMIPILEEAISRQYKQAKSVREFNSGNGISDLTIVEVAGEAPELTLHDYASMYYLVKFFNEIDRDVMIEQLIEEYQLDTKTLASLVRKLIEADFLAEIGENHYVVKKLYQPVVKNVISFEAKLRKWKDGLFQAMRYKCFSHKSYLALPASYTKNINESILKEHNVGLVAVDEKNVTVLFEPEREEPNDLVTYYHLSENLFLAKSQA